MQAVDALGCIRDINRKVSGVGGTLFVLQCNRLLEKPKIFDYMGEGRFAVWRSRPYDGL